MFPLELVVHDATDGLAVVAHAKGTSTLELGICLKSIEKLKSPAVSYTIFESCEDKILNGLIWLFLHEFSHFSLNHFELLDRGQICEGSYPSEFGLVSLRPARRDILDGIDPADWYKIEPCLEMQADHDAIELMLDAYGPDGWDILRERAAAISAMMMLIERADAERDYEHSTHPRAATRIFQLLGHIVEMPTLPARFKAEARGAEVIDPTDLPSQEEEDAFRREVVMPCFEDAVALAKAAGATTIIQVNRPGFTGDCLVLLKRLYRLCSCLHRMPPQLRLA